MEAVGSFKYSVDLRITYQNIAPYVATRRDSLQCHTPVVENNRNGEMFGIILVVKSRISE